MKPALGAYRLWTTLGWTMLAMLIVLSLVRLEQPLEFRHTDKAEHLVAYGLLMYWWGMVQPRNMLRWAIALPLLGLLLEWAQSFVPHRFMDWNDALANTLGVALGCALLATPAARLVLLLDRKLADRVDPGLP